MAASLRLILQAGALLLLCQNTLAEEAAAEGHPCSKEVASACADRPGSDVGACLKDPEEHDYPTEISSACTDFIALNKACADDIEGYCDSAHFADDTIPCLAVRTPREDLTDTCKSVLSWAIPEEAAAEEEVVTDELGLSDADYAEKKEWQEKRKAAREEAMGRMKDNKEQKEIDRKKEEDRVALEKFKEEDPEGFANMIQQQEEEKRQQALFKKQERARAAAIERNKRKASGLDEEEDATKPGSKGKKGKKAGTWGQTFYSMFSVLVVGALLYGGYVLVKKSGAAGGGGGGRSGKGKKKR